LESLIGDVGASIVEDRLARALKNARTAEVAAARKLPRVRTRRGTWRQTVARALIAVGTRLVQPRTRPQRRSAAHVAHDVTRLMLFLGTALIIPLPTASRSEYSAGVQA
jgi:hypothetical protein